MNVTAELARRGVGLAGLVNNAGVVGGLPVELEDVEAAKRLLEVNLFGAWRVTQALLPLLRAVDGARVVNVGSTSGLFCT